MRTDLTIRITSADAECVRVEPSAAFDDTINVVDDAGGALIAGPACAVADWLTAAAEAARHALAVLRLTEAGDPDPATTIAFVGPSRALEVAAEMKLTRAFACRCAS